GRTSREYPGHAGNTEIIGRCAGEKILKPIGPRGAVGATSAFPQTPEPQRAKVCFRGNSVWWSLAGQWRESAGSGHRFPARYPSRIDLEQTFRPLSCPA